MGVSASNLGRATFLRALLRTLVVRHGRLIGIGSAFLHAMAGGDSLMAPGLPSCWSAGGASPRSWSGRRPAFLKTLERQKAAG